MSDQYYGGVEGGGTNTVAIIVNQSGKVVGRVAGPGTNGYLIGVPAACDILIDLFHKAKAEAGIPLTTPLAAIGLCMSGFLEKKPQDELRGLFQERDPHLASYYYIDNDSPGSVYTAAQGAGGVVLISGTGTMGQLITADGRVVNCGGHGHMYGDEGSAYWIASNAIRRIFYAADGFTSDPAKPIPDTAAAQKLMMQYFEVSAMDGMLEVFYKHFSKARIAGFTRLLAEAAVSGDAFAQSLFAEAGGLLGSMARTLAPHLLPAGAAPGERVVPSVTIVCVGSVWKSWPLLSASFTAAATAPFHRLPAHVTGTPAAVDATALPAAERGHIARVKLVRLKETSALGAAWYAAKAVGGTVSFDPSAVTDTLYEST